MILIPASEDITVYIFSHHLSPRFLVCIFLAFWTSAVQCPQVPQSHHTYREPSLKKFPWTTLFFFITLSSFAPSSPFHSLSLLCQLVYCLLSASLKCKVHEGQNHLSYLPLSSESITCPEHSRHSISISWMDKGMLKTEVNTSSPPNKYTCFLSYCIVTIISPPIPYLKIMVNFSFYVLPTSLSKSFPEPFALSFSLLGLQLSCTWLMIVPSFFTNHPLLPPGTFSLGMLLIPPEAPCDIPLVRSLYYLPKKSRLSLRLPISLTIWFHPGLFPVPLQLYFAFRTGWINQEACTHWGVPFPFSYLETRWRSINQMLAIFQILGAGHTQLNVMGREVDLQTKSERACQSVSQAGYLASFLRFGRLGMLQ